LSAAWADNDEADFGRNGLIMCMSASAAAASPASLQNATSGFQLLSSVQGAETTVAVTMNALLVSLENFAIVLGKEAVIFLIVIGVLLHFSRLGTLLGKRLIEGGVIIGVFVLFIVPYLAVAYC